MEKMGAYNAVFEAYLDYGERAQAGDKSAEEIRDGLGRALMRLERLTKIENNVKNLFYIDVYDRTWDETFPSFKKESDDL